MGFKDWWKGLKFWQKSTMVGLLVSILWGLLSSILVLIESDFGALFLTPGALVFQKIFSCNDAPCAIFIIPFSVVLFVLFITISFTLAGFIIGEIKRRK